MGAYRVYNEKKRRWITDTYMNQNGAIYIMEHGLLKNELVNVSVGYTVHNSTKLVDTYQRVIYEGDYVRFVNWENGTNPICIVVYSYEVGGYCAFDSVTKKYYQLDDFLCKEHIEVIGNVFEGIIYEDDEFEESVKEILNKNDENESENEEEIEE